MRNLDEAKVVGIINPTEDPDSGRRSHMAPSEADPGRSADAALVRGLRSDDPEALRHLMESYWEPLVGFAQRILSGAGDPEDTVQTAFVRLWSRRYDLDEAGSLRAFLYTIVRNASLDELRKRTRRDEAQSSATPPASPRTPYEDVQGAELQRLAAAAVARLPERRREVFRLVREEGLSYQEVADIMDLSAQTVANHMSLAMADLRTALKPYFPDRLSGTDGGEDAVSDREQTNG
ncbi:MAG: RNA polymerase sigma-70 factor [Gemmatimonadetes bacterium]|nr:RNA polymerase sigma-70 factor [Gemmatimonadota bacterium]